MPATGGSADGLGIRPGEYGEVEVSRSDTEETTEDLRRQRRTTHTQQQGVGHAVSTKVIHDVVDALQLGQHGRWTIHPAKAIANLGGVRLPDRVIALDDSLRHQLVAQGIPRHFHIGGERAEAGK